MKGETQITFVENDIEIIISGKRDLVEKYWKKLFNTNNDKPEMPPLTETLMKELNNLIVIKSPVSNYEKLSIILWFVKKKKLKITGKNIESIFKNLNIPIPKNFGHLLYDTKTNKKWITNNEGLWELCKEGRDMLVNKFELK